MKRIINNTLIPGVAVDCSNIDIRKGLRLFREQYAAANILKTLKEKSIYVKKSDKRRQEIAYAVYKNQFN